MNLKINRTEQKLDKNTIYADDQQQQMYCLTQELQLKQVGQKITHRCRQFIFSRVTYPLQDLRIPVLYDGVMCKMHNIDDKLSNNLPHELPSSLEGIPSQARCATFKIAMNKARRLLCTMCARANRRADARQWAGGGFEP